MLVTKRYKEDGVSLYTIEGKEYTLKDLAIETGVNVYTLRNVIERAIAYNRDLTITDLKRRKKKNVHKYYNEPQKDTDIYLVDKGVYCHVSTFVIDNQLESRKQKVYHLVNDGFKTDKEIFENLNRNMHYTYKQKYYRTKEYTTPEAGAKNENKNVLYPQSYSVAELHDMARRMKDNREKWYLLCDLAGIARCHVRELRNQIESYDPN